MQVTAANTDEEIDRLLAASSSSAERLRRSRPASDGSGGSAPHELVLRMAAPSPRPVAYLARLAGARRDLSAPSCSASVGDAARS